MTPLPETTDGRQLRRVRNIEAVRRAILELELERLPLDLDTVAERAGVTVRSIYRYHADLDAAIADAFESRLQLTLDRFAEQRPPDVTRPLDERIEAMVDFRLELEAMGRPLRNTVQPENPDLAFDRQVADVFAPELAVHPLAEREWLTAAVCFLLRPRGLRALSESQPYENLSPRDIIAFSVRRLLVPAGDAS